MRTKVTGSNSPVSGGMHSECGRYAIQLLRLCVSSIKPVTSVRVLRFYSSARFGREVRRTARFSVRLAVAACRSALCLALKCCFRTQLPRQRCLQQAKSPVKQTLHKQTSCITYQLCSSCYVLQLCRFCCPQAWLCVRLSEAMFWSYACPNS